MDIFLRLNIYTTVFIAPPPRLDPSPQEPPRLDTSPQEPPCRSSSLPCRSITKSSLPPGGRAKRFAGKDARMRAPLACYRCSSCYTRQRFLSFMVAARRELFPAGDCLSILIVWNGLALFFAFHKVHTPTGLKQFNLTVLGASTSLIFIVFARLGPVLSSMQFETVQPDYSCYWSLAAPPWNAWSRVECSISCGKGSCCGKAWVFNELNLIVLASVFKTECQHYCTTNY
jgi:hypothetical protein